MIALQSIRSSRTVGDIRRSISTGNAIGYLHILHSKAVQRDDVVLSQLPGLQEGKKPLLLVYSFNEHLVLDDDGNVLNDDCVGDGSLTSRMIQSEQVEVVEETERVFNNATLNSWNSLHGVLDLICCSKR
jgi:hypothetical protein